MHAVDVQTVYVPLWIPLLLLGIPTAMLWHRDHRPPNEHCQNGYNLRAWYKKLIVGLLVGAALGAVHGAIPQDGTAEWQICLFYFALFPLAALVISRPWDSYRQSLIIVVTIIIGWYAVKFTVPSASELDFEAVQLTWLWWGVYGIIGLAVNATLVSVVTVLRRRFYPIHPRGHCQSCGYNLTGNVSGVCPECGEPTSG
ncbi:MAG: hypothetical protein JSV19_09200 [Phycisphaerales bacterium]|nr:MAG: hypothetical protein JSV19_09200 [Phycisphaerales bacterium]